MKKIVLIGPVYPYKGGIAHNTSLLFQTLAQKYSVELVSYKMQYPHLLFKKEQEDFSSRMFRIEEAQFRINTANPFNIIAEGKKIKKAAPDLVIIQWWHPYFAPCYWLLVKAVGQKIRRLFVCHNVFPHERFPLDRFLTKLILRQGNSFLVHSQSDAEELLRIKPDAAYRVNPLPVFQIFRNRDLTVEQAREELGEKQDTKLLLFFGFVREYKGLKYLLQAMPQIRNLIKDIRLIVAGSFGEDKEEYIGLMRRLDIEDCTKVIDGYIPDDRVGSYFTACDLVVLPYVSATQSGIVPLAYAFEKPVVVTDTGGLPDVVTDGKTGYVVEREKPEALARAVISYFSGENAEEMRENVRREAYRFKWDRIGEKIEDLMGWQDGGESA